MGPVILAPSCTKAQSLVLGAFLCETAILLPGYLASIKTLYIYTYIYVSNRDISYSGELHVLLAIASVLRQPRQEGACDQLVRPTFGIRYGRHGSSSQ